MKKLIQDQFELVVSEIKKLNGYENVNYLIRTSRSNYIFKTYTYDDELLPILEAENEVLLHLHEQQDDGRYPKPIPFANGDSARVLEIDGERTICRMLSFLDGEFLVDTVATDELYRSFGTFIAQMNHQLQTFNSYVFKARQWEWDLQYFSLNKKYLDDIQHPHNRNLVNYFFQQFDENVAPILPELRKQIIHNDANDWNVLAKNGTISGIIDFGDLAHSPLINEVAIALSYACFDKEEPIKWAAIILKSYHAVLPLEEKEISVLYYLIAARLCTSLCNSAHSKIIDPDNEYATASENAAWTLLHQWIAISPIGAENEFRKAIDLPIQETKNTEEEINKRHEHISPILSLSYEKPVSLARSAFQYMYDIHGNTILDAYNNIPHVGHSHPKVVSAGQKQMARLNTNTRYLYDMLPKYAEKLVSKFPKSLNKVYFVNSGSAATDLAMRMVHSHTQLEKVMVMEHGYHGNTQVSMDISDYKFSNKKGAGIKNHVLKTPIPDTYNGKYTNNDGSAGQSYAKDAIKTIEQSDQAIAAFITEPIVGCGGQVPLAKGYLKELYPAIRKQGGLCISDEVQTGFGRLGDHFWGFEAHEVVPDIVIIGKPMANGHPMGAVITTDAVSDSFSKGVEFFSSFGGNPVSCAVALSVLEVIEDENLQENAKIVGDFYQSLFLDLQTKYACIGDVRGSGLFIGVEIVKNGSKDPDTKLAAFIKNELRVRNILISTDGPYDNVLKTKPPMCFTKENAQSVVETIEEVLKSQIA